MILITIECSWNCQSSWNQHEQQNGGLPFQTREVQQGIPISTNHYMSPYVETVSCGEFFLTKKELTGAHKSSFFFIKTSKWEKWWSWWLRMTNAFILRNLFWKVQKNLAANREGNFKCLNEHNQNETCWCSIGVRSSKRVSHQTRMSLSCPTHKIVDKKRERLLPIHDRYT